MNDENNFNIENKFINYGSNKKEKKKSKKFILVFLLLLLLGVLGYLIYANQIEKKNNKHSNGNYEEYDPNYKLDEESNSNSSNVTSNVTSNITSNINVTSNIVNSNPSSNKPNSNNTSNKTPSKVAVTGVSIPTSTSINVGGTKTLSATITPSNATNKSVTWSSSNTSIVTVDSNGKITGKKAGTATITVTTKDGSKKATCKVTVTTNVISVTGIKLNTSTLTMSKGGTAVLTATITPTNATNKDVVWSSSNSNIVSVDQNGNVKGISVGTATITATTKDGNKKATCTITVNPRAISSISMSASSSTIYIGNSIYPVITYNPSDADGKTLTWTSSNTNIATVNSYGRVTGVAEGNVTITATTANGKKASKTFGIRHNPNTFKVTLRRSTNRNPKTGEIINYSYKYDIVALTQSASGKYSNTYIYYNGTKITGSLTSNNANLYNTNIKTVTIYSSGGYAITCVPTYSLN